jgi:Leucine-rich repeat (LRR) protein
VLGGEGFKETSLAVLPELKTLQRVLLHDIVLTEKGFSYLRQMPQLSRLCVTHSSVPFAKDEILGIVTVRQLRELSLRGASVDANDLVHLTQLKYLETLWLGGKSITDSELAGIKDLRHLKRLDLGGTKISDEGLKHLKKMDCLERLDISHTGIRDEGISHIMSLPNLRAVMCLGCNISDRSLEQLAKLKKLKTLDASACDSITADGVRAFIKARPDVELFHGFYLEEEFQ